MSEIYISMDVETDGPIPGPHSMLSLGAAAYTAAGVLDGTFAANLETLAGATGHPSTMAWWDTQPDAWAACRQDVRRPDEAMAALVAWIEAQRAARHGRPVFVGYPAGFDFLFVYWYLIKFVGRSPFSFSALDIKSFAMAVLGLPYREVSKRTMKRYLPASAHTHVAVEDAIEQGQLFVNLLQANRARGGGNRAG